MVKHTFYVSAGPCQAGHQTNVKLLFSPQITSSSLCTNEVRHAHASCNFATDHRMRKKSSYWSIRMRLSLEHDTLNSAQAKHESCIPHSLLGCGLTHIKGNYLYASQFKAGQPGRATAGEPAPERLALSAFILWNCHAHTHMQDFCFAQPPRIPQNTDKQILVKFSVHELQDNKRKKPYVAH